MNTARLRRQAFARLQAPIARQLAGRDRDALVYGATVLLLLATTGAALLAVAALAEDLVTGAAASADGERGCRGGARPR